jgi:hypothetical protein
MRRMDSDGDGKIMRVCERDREIDGYVYKYVYIYIERDRACVSVCVASSTHGTERLNIPDVMYHQSSLYHTRRH